MDQGYVLMDVPVGFSGMYLVHKEYRDNPVKYCPNSNFLCGVKWSPDGSCMATGSDDNCLRVYDLPPDCLGEGTAPCDPHSSGHLPASISTDSLAPAVRLVEGETVYDYCWYPRMSGMDPVTCCLLSTSRAHPLHLWDVCTGELRATYRAYDDADEVTAAFSVGFSPDGDRIYGGYNKCIRVFDVSRPGRSYETVVTYKKRQEGLPGMVSCLAFTPSDPGLFAAGSYSGLVGVYHLGGHDLVCVLHGHQGGVTQVQFSPDGHYLYTGARRDPHMWCWDVRFTSSAVYCMQRDTQETNQKIQFDIEPCGRHLITGGEKGAVKVFDLTTGCEVHQEVVADDTVNGCQYHPCLPLVALASGHRRYLLEPPDSSGDEEPEGGDMRVGENPVTISSKRDGEDLQEGCGIVGPTAQGAQVVMSENVTVGGGPLSNAGGITAHEGPVVNESGHQMDPEVDVQVLASSRQEKVPGAGPLLVFLKGDGGPGLGTNILKVVRYAAQWCPYKDTSEGERDLDLVEANVASTGDHQGNEEVAVPEPGQPMSICESTPTDGMAS